MKGNEPDSALVVMVTGKSSTLGFKIKIIRSEVCADECETKVILNHHHRGDGGIEDQ